MARGLTISPEAPEVAAINLSRLLSRLDDIILSPNADPNLRHSSYERTRVGANLEYARTLLLRLENANANVKIQSRKQAAQNTLLAQRTLIKRLNERLYELEQEDNDDENTSDAAEGEDLLSELNGSLSEPAGGEASPSSEPLNNTPLASSDTRNEQSAAPPVLRSRHGAPQPTPPETTATTTATSTSPPVPSATTETLLSHNTSEQESLSSSLLTLAQALKTSSQSFASALEDEKSILARADEGLDKSGASMEAAERRMGMLRRMSEGRGWWGRMLMYAWIGGLWVVALVVVFVLPKFRF